MQPLGTHRSTRQRGSVALFIIALITLLMIAWVHYKMARGLPLSPTERQLWQEIRS